MWGFTNSKLPDILITWDLYVGDALAPLPSSATSLLYDPVSVSIPSASGERKMQTPVHNKQSQSSVRS